MIQRATVLPGSIRWVQEERLSLITHRRRRREASILGTHSGSHTLGEWEEFLPLEGGGEGGCATYHIHPSIDPI